jgi:hypothetical protein
MLATFTLDTSMSECVRVSNSPLFTATAFSIQPDNCLTSLCDAKRPVF